MRKLLVLAGLAGAAAVAAKLIKDRRGPAVWHTPDTDAADDAYPRTPATSTATAAADDADDAAGATPDEALADATEEPHVPTTPDAPLEETVLRNDQA